MPAFTDDFESAVSMQTDATPLPEDAPFKLLLLGDWSGKKVKSLGAAMRRPQEIDRDDFDDVMRKFDVSLDLDLHGDGKDVLSLHFGELEDFHPDNIFRQVSLFSDLRETRRRLLDPNTFNRTAKEVRDWFGTEIRVNQPQREKSQRFQVPIPRRLTAAICWIKFSRKLTINRRLPSKNRKTNSTN